MNVGWITAGGIFIGGGGVGIDGGLGVAVVEAAGGIVAGGTSSPPACGGAVPPEVLSILLLALSILALPSGLSAMASCILILHCFV